MKYGYLDLGPQPRGSEIVVRVRGGATGVLLLSSADFVRYKAGRSFSYRGGRYRGRPVRIKLPRNDHWFAILELGSHSGQARATVEVLPPDGKGAEQKVTASVG